MEPWLRQFSHTKSIFSQHGIPQVVISDNRQQFSDNRQQFSSEAYKWFAQDYQFKHVRSSPYYHWSNGEAEQEVGTVKRLMEKKGDPYLALLSGRKIITGNTEQKRYRRYLQGKSLDSGSRFRGSGGLRSGSSLF